MAIKARDILKKALEDALYDGLYAPDGSCSCLVADLGPCGEDPSGCYAGHKVPCPGDGCMLDGNCGFHIG